MPAGQVKPSGPQTIDKTHPRAAGLVAFLWLAVYDRELTAAEKQDEAANPYAFVVPATGVQPVTTTTSTAASPDGTMLTTQQGQQNGSQL